MNKLIFTTILGAFLMCGVKAQTLNDMPVFSNKTIVMKILLTTAGAYTPYITISDGNTSFTMDLIVEPIYPKKEKEESNTKTIALVINKLGEQGFKLIGTSSGELGILFSYNYFQKE